MRIVVQEILIEWSKDSRGGPKAGKRNAVPEVFVLPEIPRLIETPVLHHWISVEEGRGFALDRADSTLSQAVLPFKAGSIEVRERGSEIVVTYRHNGMMAGAPTRVAPPKNIPLVVDQWMRIAYNGRYGGEGHWWYRKMIFNIGLFTEPRANVFMATSPRKEVRDLADLW